MSPQSNSQSQLHTTDFSKALRVGRPPNIVKLFPNSKALLVSGKLAFGGARGRSREMEG